MAVMTFIRRSVLRACAATSVGFLLARPPPPECVSRHWLAVCAAVPDPYYVRACFSTVLRYGFIGDKAIAVVFDGALDLNYHNVILVQQTFSYSQQGYY